MKTAIFIFLAIVGIANAHFHHNLGEHQQLMNKYQGTRGVSNSPYRYAAPRNSIKSALEGNTHAVNYRTPNVYRTPVYMVEKEEEISDHQLKDLCHQLNTYDNDPHDVSKDQFAEFLRSFGVDFTDERIAKIYKKINNAKSAGFDLDRFCEKKFKKKTKSEREELEEIFQEIDKDGSGKIDRTEIRKEMKRRNVFNEVFLDQLLDDADKNGDGKVSFKEFLNMAEIL